MNTEMNEKMIDFEKPYYLSKKELFSIVSPEYITFSEAKNNLEVIIVKSNLFLNNRKIDLSFGPFQMKISFIKNLIKELVFFQTYLPYLFFLVWL